MREKSLRVLGASAMLVGLLFVSCKKDDGGTGPGDGGAYTGPVGTVIGKVVAANGVTPIPSASVTVEANYTNMPITTTDTSGNYTLAGVPTGNQKILATKGLFRATVTVDVIENQTATAPPASMQPTGNLAYVPGSFDQIEDIIRDTLGSLHK